MPPSSIIHDESVAATAILGFDDVLGGGLRRRRLFLVEGVPGSGKTTLGLQFLQAAAARGEPVLYVTLSETEEELRAVASSHGWDLEGISIHELAAVDDPFDPDEQNTMFHASEVELGATIKAVLDRRRGVESHVRRVRFPVRTAASRGQRVALPSADSRPQAVFLRRNARSSCSTT